MVKRVWVLFSLLWLATVSSVGAIDEVDNGEETTAGDIAIVDSDYNIRTMTAEGDLVDQITDDAAQDRRYQWPTWSTDGRLAYFCCDLRGAATFSTEAYISPDGRASGEVVFEGDAQPIIYAAWSPSNCGAGNNCRDLAMLINNVPMGTLSVEIARNQISGTTLRSVGRGSPFYYHWNPSGNQMIFHRGNDAIDIYDVDSEDVIDSYDTTPTGAFQTPSWSPIDDRVMFGVRNPGERRTNLVVVDGNDERTLVEDIPGLVAFLWSPDGKYVAYRSFSRSLVSALYVVDVETGDVVSETQYEGVISFFWSPDSRKIAYITPASVGGASAQVNNTAARIPIQQENNALHFRWHVLNVETDMTTSHDAFYGTYEMTYLMQYFDQFAPSHRLWSPDSRYLVYGSIVDADNPRPMIQRLDTITSEAKMLREGVFAVWNFGG